MKAEQSLCEMHDALDRDPASMSDMAIVEAVRAWKDSLKTSCDAAAQALFAAVAPVCFHRPHLTRDLLRMALEPLVFLGIERREQVSAWIDWYLQQANPYMEVNAIGRQWLESSFVQQGELVQALIDEILHDTHSTDA